MFSIVIQKFKLEGKIVFITTDGARSAKRQVEITSAEENIIIDIFEDPIDVDASDPDDTIVDIEEILCRLSVCEDDEHSSFVHTELPE